LHATRKTQKGGIEDDEENKVLTAARRAAYRLQKGGMEDAKKTKVGVNLLPWLNFRFKSQRVFHELAIRSRNLGFS